jgi:sigma54-dependent transcription regulator
MCVSWRPRIGICVKPWRGAFRTDLSYRVNVFDIHIPPLRRRRDEISALAAYFLHEFGQAPGGRRVELTPDALDGLPARLSAPEALYAHVQWLHFLAHVDTASFRRRRLE